MKKRVLEFNTGITVAIIACFLLLIISELFLLHKIEKIQTNQYKTKALENSNLLNTFIENKKNATLVLAITLSEIKTIKEALIQNQYHNINLKNLSQELKKKTEYENVWIQVVDKYGTSQYRNWIDKKGDSLIEIRDDIRLMLQNPQIIKNISVGLFDMTFKSMVPIFHENEFIGIIEVISKFNSIVKQLKHNEIEPIILVNKKYTSQFIKPFTNNFIQEYYVANLDVPEELIEHINSLGVETLWNKENYIISEPYFISLHKEYDLSGDIMANFILFQKIQTVKSPEIMSFKILSQLIILAIFTVALTVVLLIYLYLKKEEKTTLNKILQEHNDELQNKVKLEIEKNRKKDTTLANQSKLVALGEMLGNIAHQWRQPLSAISTATSGLQIKYEYDLLSKKEFLELTQGVIDNTKYLSDTIEDFRGFFKKDKEKEKFNLASTITSSYNIIKALYNIKEINIIFDLDETIEYKGYKTELSQVLLNLFNNAKDAIIQNNIHYKIVYIKLYCTKESIVLEFHDNAGGISDEINDRIFDPYFTTKHQTQGTGIGLYMSNEIITKHFNGKIYSQNQTFQIEDVNYFGATIIIELPFS